MNLYTTQPPRQDKTKSVNESNTKIQSDDFDNRTQTTPSKNYRIDKKLEQKAGQVDLIELDQDAIKGSNSIPYEKEFKGFSTALASSRTLQRPELDVEARRVLRVHFTDHILKDLERLQNECGKPTAAVYADNILRTIRAMRDRSPFDPFLEVVMALYDAMAYQNRWLSYSKKQYIEVHNLLKNLANREFVRNDHIEKAILELEDIGLDTLPYEVDIDFGIDDYDADSEEPTS